MTTIVDAKRVSKRFGPIAAVDAVTLAVAEGEIFALLGPNGAGKTTLIRMVVGLIEPDEGEITRAFPNSSGALGYLPEERGLYQDMPILRTLQYFARLQGMPARDAASAALAWLERFDLAKRGSEKVKALSKGNQQKVQFAAAILHRPRIAILDEPFSGLDPVNQDVFLGLIRELRDSGTTVIFSAHQMPLVEQLADRVFLMSRGREILHGSIPELRSRWRAGNRVVIGTSTAAETTFLREAEGVEAVEAQSDREISLRLKPGASLSGVLRLAGERLDVRYVKSEEASLHEIYVKTVGADRPTADQAGRGAA